MTAPPFCSAKSPSAKILCSIAPPRINRSAAKPTHNGPGSRLGAGITRPAGRGHLGAAVCFGRRLAAHRSHTIVLLVDGGATLGRGACGWVDQRRRPRTSPTGERVGDLRAEAHRLTV